MDLINIQIHHKKCKSIDYSSFQILLFHRTIKLSVDIDKTAPELISLLEKASPFQEQWQQSVVFKQIIQRYYRFMQLKSSNSSNILLIPTLDIEMIWQTHLLRPEIYKNDCLRLFGRVIDHSLIINNINQSFKEEAFFDTCQLYQKRFEEIYCSLPEVASNNPCESLNDNEWIYSYWDKTHFQFSSNSPNNYENPFSFTEGDFILDGKWLDMCKLFMCGTKKNPIWIRFFNKSKEIDLGSEALKRLKKSYERFLYMAAKYSLKDGNGFIPPTYAVNILLFTDKLLFVDFRSILYGIHICKNHQNIQMIVFVLLVMLFIIILGRLLKIIR